MDSENKIQTKSKLYWPSPTSVVKNFVKVICFTIIFTTIFLGVDMLGTYIQTLFL